MADPLSAQASSARLDEPWGVLDFIPHALQHPLGHGSDFPHGTAQPFFPLGASTENQQLNFHGGAMREAERRHSLFGALPSGAAAFTLLLMACGGGGGGSATPLPPATYTVAYDGNANTGGTPPVDSNTYQQGATVTVLGNTGSLVKTGDRFSGWNTVAGGSGTMYTQGQTFAMGTANVTLFAQWTSNGGSGFAVTYDANGATGGSVPVDSNRYGTGQAITVAANSGGLTCPGYAFAGWQTKADGSGMTYAPGGTCTMGSANTTLYALWAGGYAYTVNHNEGAEGAIAQFAIGPNGALSPLSTPMVAAGGKDTWWVAVDPSSKYLYATNPAANNQQGTLTQFTIDPTKGSLSPMSPLTVPFPTGWNSAPSRGVSHPTGPWFYLINTQPGTGGAVSQFTLGATGELMSPSLLMVGPTPGQAYPNGIAIDPTGQYAYVAGRYPGGAIFQYTVNQTTGALQPNPSGSNNVVATPPFTSLGTAQPYDIKILKIPSGEYAYVSNYDDGTLWEFSINPATGTLSLLGTILVAPDTVCTCEAGGNNIAAEDIALHPSGKYAYVTFSCCSSPQSVAQFTINQTDGTLTPMTPPTVRSSGSAASIAVEASGKYAYVTSGDTGFANSTIAQYTIDQGTGALTLMANPTVETGGIGPSGIVTVGK